MQVEIQKTIKALNDGNTVLYPTDTVWGVGCDATDQKAVAKIYRIKNRSESKSLIILVDSIEMLRTYIQKIPEKAISILKTSKRPTTIIYNEPCGLAKNVIAKDNTIAIRIVQDEFCKNVIKEFGKPLVSTSANCSGRPTPKSFQEIDNSILDGVDYVVNLRHNEIANVPSRIIKINVEGELVVIRD